MKLFPISTHLVWVTACVSRACSHTIHDVSVSQGMSTTGPMSVPGSHISLSSAASRNNVVSMSTTLTTQSTDSAMLRQPPPSPHQITSSIHSQISASMADHWPSHCTRRTTRSTRSPMSGLMAARSPSYLGLVKNRPGQVMCWAMVIWMMFKWTHCEILGSCFMDAVIGIYFLKWWGWLLQMVFKS